MRGSCTCVHCLQKQFSGRLSDLRMRQSRGTKTSEVRHRPRCAKRVGVLGDTFGYLVDVIASLAFQKERTGQIHCVTIAVRTSVVSFNPSFFSCSGQVDEIAEMK